MKISMYELLGLVKDGKAPKKVRFDNVIWNKVYGENNILYEDEYDNDLFIHFFRKNLDFTLNEEVEILEEEEKKIPEKLEYWQGLDKVRNDCKLDDLEYAIKYGNYNFEMFFNKINQIIDYLKSKGDE